MHLPFAFASGATFGLGLLVSGMTDTSKVQGWLDIFGAWDPTLAFVLGGAMLPMAIAWAWLRQKNRSHSALGTALPSLPKPELDRNLIIGSTMFGMGWALAGLCPGPALASISFGGTSGVIFLLSMLVGMLAARPVTERLSKIA